MMSRILSFALFLIIVVIVAFNFNALLSYGRANQIEQSAQKAIEAQNWEKGIQLYEEGHKQFPDNATIALRLAWLYRKNQQNSQAEATYRTLLKQAPDHLEARMALAGLLKNDAKRVNEAIVELRQALKAHPKNPQLLASIGNVYKTAAENPAEKREATQKWLYAQARYYYQQSLKLNNQQFQTHFNLGVSYQNIDDNTAAAKAYCQALVVSPNSYEARYNLGLVLSDLSFEEEAYRQMGRAIQILSDRNDMAMAQGLAVKVQNVKNRIFNSNRPTLTGQEIPPFLDKACLVQGIQASPEGQ
ncbi:tetratricopeptide repeat protein [Vampirovibrio sp.]|uniref:tetratricopeptide repeat protein n=1 Tax=Vampirovibrio sp. TaxID=2717857 RepID=UPI003593A9A1